MNKVQISLGQRIVSAITPNILKGTKNELCESNTGLRALIYGKRKGNAYRPGLIHLITAGRFRKELIYDINLIGDFSESAAVQRSGISKSIPRGFKNAFTETKYMEELIESPICERLADAFSRLRKGYDMLIDKPIARVRSGIYFVKEGIKDFFKFAFKKDKKIDMDFVKMCLGHNIKIPEGLSESQLKEFLVSELRKTYSKKEVTGILKGKAPTFYRFVDETELRAVQNGFSMRSSAAYHVDNFRTDITSDPKYNFNKYRITFKRNNKNWNPYELGSFVKIHENSTRKWWLFGDGYDRNDILCTERIK